ncbi:molybdenum cofactor guanylyltransferase [cyanobiont of Ornithocercus magnificus]|nr:molybdenum cofactor guanylyltransferase [cyanobiont of Ornithocercus magnificus]
MGCDKALLPHPLGGSWLERAASLPQAIGLEVWLLSGHDLHHEHVANRPGIHVVPESLPPSGPLQAIASMFSTSEGNTLLVLPVDMPSLEVRTLKQLMEIWREQESMAVVADDGECLQPLLGIYPCSPCNRKALDTSLAMGKGRWLDWLMTISYRRATLPAAELVNANSYKDLEAL